MLENPKVRYHLLSRILHWGMALIIFCLIGVGLYMTGLADDNPNRGQFYFLHKSFGSVIFILVFIRLAWLFFSPPPPPPADFTKFEILLSKSVMGLLYFLMVAMPISGYLASTFAGYGVSLFGLFTLPVLVATDPENAKCAAEAHEIMGYTMIVLVALHILGALKHRIKGNPEADVLKRML